MNLPVPQQRSNVPVGSVLRVAAALALALVVAGAGCDRGAPASASVTTESGAAAGVDVRSGLEVLLADSLALVVDRQVGLVTNHTGIDRDGVSSIDRLFAHPDVDLVALFSPEHGIRGEEEAGIQIASGLDSFTRLPIHSLYGDTRKPTPQMLVGVEVLVFDIQDIGSRYYTYVSTMALAMEAAGEAGIPFVVLDRPNPIGGIAVQGSVLDTAYATFVGRYPIPMRHGMTPGELARMMVGEFGVSVDLTVVPAAGWTRAQSFGETGLPWVAPSPNMPSVTSALHYPGTCLFEGTNLSVGRGTPAAFQQIGAPWIDGPALASRLEELELPGVRFEPVTFTPLDPGDGKFDATAVHGVRLVAVDSSYDPTLTAIALLVETRRVSAERWTWHEPHFDRLAGTGTLRAGIEEGAETSTLTADWGLALDGFRLLRAPYLLYPD